MRRLKIKSGIKNIDKVLLFSVLFLTIFGLLNIVTASSREAVTNLDKSEFYYFFKHGAILVMSLIGSIIAIMLPTEVYKKIMPPIYIIVLVLNTFLIFSGNSTRGARNWIPLGFFNLQPSEIAKPVVIITIACLFEKFYKAFKNNDSKLNEGIGLIAIVGLLTSIVVGIQRDLGTAIILFGIFLMLFLTSPILLKKKMKSLLILFILAFIALSLFVIRQGTLLTEAQKSRFDFYDPCSKYETTGYQICNAFIAINKGGLFGVGIGKSSQKYSYIPEPHTDMVFSIISEEYGLIKCTFIFILYLIILYRILKISSESVTIRGRYICIGTATYIFLHILINLGGLFGLIPLTGVPLPLLSYGGSFTLSLLVILGVVQRVQIENKNKKIEIK